MKTSGIDPETKRALDDIRRWRSSRSIEQVLNDLRRDMATNPTLRALVIFAGEELTRDDYDNEETTITED